ncbi:hypothetical protein ACFQH8_15770 [Halomicroarcula sp. GCM10025710]
MGARGYGPGARGQSAPLGLLLVFAVMIIGTTAVVALGAGAIDSTQTQLDAERIENTMTQFDSETSLVALGQSGVQQVELSATVSSGYTVDGSAGWMNLSYENRSTGVQTTIYNESMGVVTYEGRDGSRIAYQGGGVWRRDPTGSSSVMVSPPEFHYRNATLTLPLVTVSGDGVLNERAAVTRNSSRVFYPNQSINSAFRNPLQNGEVTVTVQSDYYRAWGTYFEERTEGEVSYDHPKNRVTLRLVSPIEKRKITSATASLSASGSFVIQGSSISACGGSPTPYTDSYDSSGTNDDYCTQKSNGATGTNGDVVYGDDVDISSGAGSDEILGNVTAGGSVIVGNGGGKPYVHGNISHTDNCTPSESDCASRITDPNGNVEQINGVQTVSSINGLVRDTVDDAASDNDNGATVNVSSNQLDFDAAGPSDTVELYAGTYYLTNIDFSGGDEPSSTPLTATSRSSSRRTSNSPTTRPSTWSTTARRASTSRGLAATRTS